MEAPIQQDLTEVQTGIEPVPQETQQTEPQSVPTTLVEGVQPTSQDNRSQADFETARQIKSLMKEIRSLKQSFETRPSAPAPSSPKPQVTRDQLLADPLTGIGLIAQSEVSKLRDELTEKFQQREAQVKHDQAVQEGLRLIKTNELIKKDPEGEERIKEILLEDNGNGSLQQFSQFNPLYAAQLVLNEYKLRYGGTQRGTFAPTKGQMVSTATATNTGSGKLNTDQEIEALHKKLNEFPDLMKDKDFMAKIGNVLKQSKTESMMGK